MQIQSLADRFCEYSRYIRGYSSDTIRRYQQTIRNYSQFAKVTDIEQVTSDNVRGFFFHGRTENDWGVNTFITYHKSLVVFFRWCVGEKVLPSNPAEEIEIPKLEKKLPPKLTRQEALRILEVVYNYPYKYKFLRYRNQAIFAVFLFAGLRKKELLKLRFTDVDIPNMSIFVYQGKGSKDRIIPIPSKLVEILNNYLAERKRLNKTCPEFFASLNHNIGLTNTGLKRLVELMSKTSKIKFTIHKLRHTFATLMLEGGCDIYSLSRMMGHSDIKTTTIYLAASAEHLRSQIIKHPLNNL
ncbi:MAG: tyrosine-type recombinase/integrase [Candidatus Parcubacteria bacterium]|nr:tyrosine-type recombinase/integrase [Candidatus Parcubacteria bacterium]